MASLNPKAAVIACPNCGAQYDFPPAMAGKRGRCVKCGEAFRVPADVVSQERLEDLPQYIGLECHLCGTRMYGGPDQIGKLLKCPDCGARTELKRPEPKRRNTPAALEGEQYELMEPDEPAARPAAANHPKYIAVTCQRCETLMYATEQQVGQTVTCPDCGRKETVPAPRTPKAKASPLVSDADTPRLDPDSVPFERPSAYTEELRRKVEEEERSSAYGRALEEARRTGKPMKVDVRGRPIMPRQPLLSGILPFMISAHVPEWWIALSLAFLAGGYLISEALIWGGLGGLAAISALIFFIFGSIITFLTGSVAACVFKAIVVESSEGSDRVENWGTRYVADWFPEMLFMMTAVFISTFPGAAIARLIGGDLLVQYLFGAAGAAVVFPIVYLSQLDFNSPWGVLSGRILASIAKCLGSWILFYIETGLIIAACLGVGIWAAKSGVYPVLPFPVYVAALLLYARILGRLAWRVAEAMAVEE